MDREVFKQEVEQLGHCALSNSPLSFAGEKKLLCVRFFFFVFARVLTIKNREDISCHSMTVKKV